MGVFISIRLYGAFLAVLSFILLTIGLLPEESLVDRPNIQQQIPVQANPSDAPSKTHLSPSSPSSSIRSPIPDSPPAPGFELVLSHYSRDYDRIAVWTNLVRQIPYVAKLGMKLTIYTKNPSVDLEQLKIKTRADEVYLIPNIGREGQTIVHHIMRVLDHPAQFTMFAQDEPEWSLAENGNLNEFFWRKLNDDFRPNTGFLALNDNNEPCNCGDCGGFGRFPLQTAVYNNFLTGDGAEECAGTNWNAWWSQFIVSRQRMQMHGLEKWDWLEKMIAAPKDHWVHEVEEPQFIRNIYMPEGSTPDNPLFGHTLERSWNMIFECAFEDRVPLELGKVNQQEANCWDWRMEREKERKGEMLRR